MENIFWIVIIFAIMIVTIFLQHRTIARFESKQDGINAQRADLERQIQGHRAEMEAERKSIEKQKADMDYELKVARENLASRKAQMSHDLYVSREKAKAEIDAKRQEIMAYLQRIKIMESNLTALPYMAGIIADFDTRGLEIYAKELSWGDNAQRKKKVKSIREIRREAQELIAQSKEAKYQLEYAINMFPALQDFLETDFRDLPPMEFSDIQDGEHDKVRDYLSKEEFEQLSSTARNQLALDRYRESRRKTNWQIGRDYEQFVGYVYTKKGYRVDYFGAYNGLEDLGRDLIAVNQTETLIIQCKYWSSKKQIHENHINQLYGTMVCYCFENHMPRDQVKGVLVTNITVSDTARKFAEYLGIEIVEKCAIGNYPCIKCNINRSEYGEITKIYHLPFDQQYDSCKISLPGEFFAMTVSEAEAAGFRRAYRWHGEN